MKQIHPEVLKAHKKARELQEKVNANSRFDTEGNTGTKAPPAMRGAASRAERKLGKVIKKHYPGLSLQEDVNLRTALQEHEQPHWKQ